MKFYSEIKHFISRKCTWKCSLWNGGHLSRPQWVKAIDFVYLPLSRCHPIPTFRTMYKEKFTWNKNTNIFCCGKQLHNRFCLAVCLFENKMYHKRLPTLQLCIINVLLYTVRDHFCVHPANERRRYNVTSSLIGWVHTQNDSCTVTEIFDILCCFIHCYGIAQGYLLWLILGMLICTIVRLHILTYMDKCMCRSVVGVVLYM